MMLSFWHSVLPFLVAVAVFSVALLFGRLLLARLRELFSTELIFLCAALGVGLGALGLLTLLLGLLGGWRSGIGLGLLLVLLIVSVTQAPPLRRELFGAARRMTRAARTEPVTALFLAVFAAYTVMIFLDNCAPPISFDVVEYHLGGVREFLKEGRIRPISGNFYAAMPMQIEMLFGLGLLVEGSETGLSPKMINFLLFLATNVTLYALLGHATQMRAWRLAGCLLFSLHPLIFKIGIVAKNDLGLTFFALLAVLCWAEWLRDSQRAKLALMGVFMGFAVGCKLTAVGILLLPAAIALIPFGAWNNKPAKLLQAELLFLGAALAIFAPWAIKNLIFYGNPVYPLLPGLFPNESFSLAQYAFYCQHHHMASIFSAEFWGSAIARLGNYHLLFWLPFIGVAFVPHAKMPGGAQWSGVGLLLFVALGHLACNVLTDNPDRFQAPLLPAIIFGLLIVYRELVARWRSCLWLAAPFALWPFLYVDLWSLTISPKIPDVVYVSCWKDRLPQYALNRFVGRHDEHQFRERLLGKPPADAWRFVASDAMRADATILLLYEAQWYYFPQRVIGNTVFDRSAICRLLEESGAASGQELLDYLREIGIDYLFVNEFELLRTIRDIAPDRALQQAFPGFASADELRARLRQPEAALELLDHDELYPPYLFEKSMKRKLTILHEFYQLAGQRLIFESNAQPAPRIWIAELKK